MRGRRNAGNVERMSMPDRELAIKSAYLAVKYRLDGMTFDQFAESVKDFEAMPLHYKGECRGAVLVRGKEVHTCVTPPWYGRQAIKIISRIVMEYGEATTHVTTEAGRRMVIKLGFVKDVDSDIYRSKKAWA